MVLHKCTERNTCFGSGASMTTDNSPSRSLAIKDGSASRRRQTMRAPRRRQRLDEPTGQILAYSVPGAGRSACQPSPLGLRPSAPFWPPRPISGPRSRLSDAGSLPSATPINSQAMSPHKCRSRQSDIARHSADRRKCSGPQGTGHQRQGTCDGGKSRHRRQRTP
jgi:hypothetical protein